MIVLDEENTQKVKKKSDRISLETAMDSPFWKAILISEPCRPIDVEMTYMDLSVIVGLLKKKNEHTDRD